MRETLKQYAIVERILDWESGELELNNLKKAFSL